VIQGMCINYKAYVKKMDLEFWHIY